uniref:ShKT domain-containing protein n=1 Tax=Acrobeloides nanus TaxID=290746 RepID=A0A914DXJ9_9BILA
MFRALVVLLALLYSAYGQCPAGYTDAGLPCFTGSPSECPSSATQTCFNSECCTNPTTTTTTTVAGGTTTTAAGGTTTTTAGGSAGTCADNSTTCTAWASNGFCSSTFYSTAQKQSYCAKTCGLCAASATTTTTAVTITTTTTAKTCSDNSTSCTTWSSNGFCTSTFYTVTQRCQYCGKTCNLCGKC